MEIKEKLEQAATFLPLLEEYNRSRTLDFGDTENSKKFRSLYQSIYTHVQIDMSCSSCVSHCLNMLAAWYHRENEKYLKTQANDLTVQTEVVQEPEKEIPVKKTKGKKVKKLATPIIKE